MLKGLILKIDCFNLNNQFYLISHNPYCINQANAEDLTNEEAVLSNLNTFKYK